MAKTTVQFIVEFEGTDVPPDWEGKVKKRLQEEMRLRFGTMATVLVAGEPVQGKLFE